MEQRYRKTLLLFGKYLPDLLDAGTIKAVLLTLVK